MLLIVLFEGHCCYRVKAIATRVKALKRVKAIATIYRVKAIATRVKAIATRVKAILLGGGHRY